MKENKLSLPRLIVSIASIVLGLAVIGGMFGDLSSQGFTLFNNIENVLNLIKSIQSGETDPRVMLDYGFLLSLIIPTLLAVGVITILVEVIVLIVRLCKQECEYREKKLTKVSINLGVSALTLACGLLLVFSSRSESLVISLGWGGWLMLGASLAILVANTCVEFFTSERTLGVRIIKCLASLVVPAFMVLLAMPIFTLGLVGDVSAFTIGGPFSLFFNSIADPGTMSQLALFGVCSILVVTSGAMAGNILESLFEADEARFAKKGVEYTPEKKALGEAITALVLFAIGFVGIVFGPSMMGKDTIYTMAAMSYGPIAAVVVLLGLVIAFFVLLRKERKETSKEPVTVVDIVENRPVVEEEPAEEEQVEEPSKEESVVEVIAAAEVVKEEPVEEKAEEPVKEEAPKAEEAPAEEKVEETPKAEEAPAEEKVEEPAKEEAPKAEEVKEEKPAKKAAPKKAPAKKEAPKKEEKKEEPVKEEKKAEEKAEKKEPAKKEASKGDPGYRTYHLVKREDGKWEVKFAGGQKAIKLFDTQIEALEYSKKMAENQGGKVLVHNSKGANKGRIQKKR